MSEKIQVGKGEDFPIGKMKVVTVSGKSVLVARLSEHQICAVENRCAHLGLPLSGGKLEQGVISCPFHNSRFEMCSGQNLDWVTGVAGIKTPSWSRRLLELGRKPHPIQSYMVSEENGVVYIEA